MRPNFLRRSGLSRLLKIIAIIFTIWTTLDILAVRRALIHSSTHEPKPLGSEKIFIASIHWTDELVLRSHWMSALLDLAKDLGPDNVFVSIEESGSLDDTKGALQMLDAELEAAGIRKNIMLDATTRLEVVEQKPAEAGWIVMPFDKRVRETKTTWTTIPKDKVVPRRIPYLAGLRNLVLQPLFELEKAGERFDKILFLNDVVFDTNDVRNLLSTRNGDYAAACALDFKHAPAVYDTFAARDSDGYELLMETWPYFRSPRSLNAVRQNAPIPVTSCWNGMLIMDAAPFYPSSTNNDDRLAFRAISDSLGAKHLEGSECCLIHTDNPLSASKGVWINPNVRVAYSGSAYDAVNPSKHGTSASQIWLSALSIAMGSWESFFRRWMFSSSAARDRVLAKRLAEWRRENPGEKESGQACLIDETQVLIFNGWVHI